ncbi:hypothetical protein C1I95_18440 [Micromonospora craterilacus]|uniref:Uncharacterized protein n=1 Tax=Micromonospora craterilacus TaxID=1655439 RepID=A0A2W2DW02_9ACTN|nr:hypothetical protein [Micromonospora craterilacus]PZG16056.1 hypothetical protein C1I95_18440 [Micromonospora craterilacus]
MSEPAEATAPARAGSWFAVAAATVIAVTAWAGYWWLAVPRYDICAAVLPAPAGCRIAGRIPIATLWTAIIAVLYLATAALAVVRPRGRWWPFVAGVAVLAIAALWGYRAVQYAGG